MARREGRHTPCLKAFSLCGERFLQWIINGVIHLRGL
jgi:hypothetical protein